MTNEKECHVEPIEKQPTANEMELPTDALLAISGMGCANCAARVRNNLLQLHGVVEAKVDHKNGAARVVYNNTMLKESDLVQAVVRAGGDGHHNYFAQIQF